MKNLFVTITMLTLLFFPCGMIVATPQDNEELPLKEIIPPPGDRPRDECIPHVVCYLVQDSVVLHTVGATVSANVCIENLTNGIDTYYNTVLDIVPVLFPLFGTGDYVITITMSSGAIYQGTFNY